MSYDVEFFLEAMLLDAKNELQSSHYSQCSKSLHNVIEQFISGFKRHLEKNGFNMEQLEFLNRNFGANLYFSLTECGGFNNEKDPVGKIVHEELINYAGKSRFRDLVNYLTLDNCNRIVLGVFDESTEELVKTFFQV